MLRFEQWMLKSPRTAIKTLFVYSRDYHALFPNQYSRDKFMTLNREAVEWYKRIAAHPRLLSIDTMLNRKIVQPYWASAIRKLAQMISWQKIPEGFLNLRIIQSNMVPRGWDREREFELSSLLQDGEASREISSQFVESKVGWPHIECRAFRCSSSTLLHLYNAYQLCKTMAMHSVPYLDLGAVIEWGAGYGGFCRAFQFKAKPQRYIIIDFAEMQVLQYLFLKLNYPESRVVLWEPGMPFNVGKIMLFPVQAIEDLLGLECNLFVSHVALSESGAKAISLAVDSDFFGAGIVHAIGESHDRRGLFEATADLEHFFKSNVNWFTLRRSHHTGDNRYEIFSLRK